MTITGIDESQRKAASVAGFTSIFTLPFVVFANFAIHDRLIVAGNVAETARNICPVLLLMLYWLARVLFTKRYSRA